MTVLPELLVLAGGFGSRLRSVVSDVPKPLAPIDGQPFIAHLMANWYQQGIRRATFLLHHQAELIVEYLTTAQRGGSWPECRIRYLTESKPLGTGGALAHAFDSLSIRNEIIVANADTWLSEGIAALSDVSAPAIGTVWVTNTERYGMVHCEGDSVSAFLEKEASGGPGWINAGLYKLGSKDIQGATNQCFSLERDVFPDLVVQRRLRQVKLETDFIDIGVPDDYHRFCAWVASDRKGKLCN